MQPVKRRRPAGGKISLPHQTILLDVYQRGIRMEAQNALIIAEQGRAAESRREIHARLNELAVELALMTVHVTRIAPLVDAAELRRHQAAVLWKVTGFGVRHMRKVVWAAVAAAAVFVGHALLERLPEPISRLFK